MSLKTYRARTIADALAEVKRDLGKDAVILRTRSYRAGGFFGLGSRAIVEITASDGSGIKAVRPRTAPRQGPAAGARTPDAAPLDALRRAYGVPLPRPGPPPRSSGATAAPPTPNGPDLVSAVREVARAATVQGAANSQAAGLAVEQELVAIRRLVGQVLQCSRQTAARVGGDQGAAALPDALGRHYLKLLESEVASEIADELIGRVRDELNPGELADDGVVRQTVLRHLAAIIPADESIARPAQTPDGRPRTIALIGPTGVGKTTTVAKLAAAYKLRHGKRVGLVTSDTFRIAAVDQLRTYAEIIGLPLKVVLTPGEMATTCAALSDCDVVLIDTAGRSQRDAGRLQELKQFIAAARPHETHLVLSSTCGERVLVETAERFAQVSPDRVIFTKLDEAVNFGVLVTVARRIALTLSYVTTGQEVPENIEPGRSDRLARLVLDGRGPA